MSRGRGRRRAATEAQGSQSGFEASTRRGSWSCPQSVQLTSTRAVLCCIRPPRRSRAAVQTAARTARIIGLKPPWLEGFQSLAHRLCTQIGTQRSGAHDMRGGGRIAADLACARPRHAVIVRRGAGLRLRCVAGRDCTDPAAVSTGRVRGAPLPRRAGRKAARGLQPPMRRIASLPSQWRAVSRMCAKNRPFGPLTSETSTTVPGCASVAK